MATVVGAIAVSLTACSPDNGVAPVSTTAPPVTASPTATPARTVSARVAQQAPTSLTVTCTTKGAAASSAVVRARADGVYIRSARKSGKATQLQYLSTPVKGSQPYEGSVPITTTASTSVFPAPPGSMRLACTNKDGKALGRTTAVVVADPLKAYRFVDVAKALDCTPDQKPSSAQTAGRASSEVAFDDLVARLGTDYAWKPGPGYRATTQPVAIISRKGGGYGLAAATLQSNGSYVAQMTAAC